MANGSTLPGFVPTQNTGYMCIRELPYADDSALVANNAVDICMQQIVDRSSSAADMLGLKIIISKTELLYQPPPMSIELPETITVHDNRAGLSLTCMGSTVTNINSAGLEV